MKISKNIITKQNVNIEAIEKKLAKSINYIVKTREERVLERAKASVLNTLRRQAANNVNTGTYPSQNQACGSEKRIREIYKFCKQLGLKHVTVIDKDHGKTIEWQIVKF